MASGYIKLLSLIFVCILDFIFTFLESELFIRIELMSFARFELQQVKKAVGVLPARQKKKRPALSSGVCNYSFDPIHSNSDFY